MLDEELKIAIRQAEKNISTFHRSQLILRNQKWKSSQVFNAGENLWLLKKLDYIFRVAQRLCFPHCLCWVFPQNLPDVRRLLFVHHLKKMVPFILPFYIVAKLLGISNLYRVGGVQAIAAMAYGTQTYSDRFIKFLALETNG